MSHLTKTVVIVLALGFSALAGAHAETARPVPRGAPNVGVNSRLGVGSLRPQGLVPPASFGGGLFRPIRPIGIAPIIPASVGLLPKTLVTLPIATITQNPPFIQAPKPVLIAPQSLPGISGERVAVPLGLSD